MVVAKQLEEHPKTKSMLDECRVESKQRFGLSDMLKVPFQRILKYPLLLKELWKKTPEAHFDKSGLEVSLAGIKTVTQLINARKAESEQVVAILSRSRGTYTGKPAHMLGKLLHEGVCGMPVGRVLGSAKVEARQLYLFADTLLIFKPVQSKSRRLSTKLSVKRTPSSDGDANPGETELTFKGAITLSPGTKILDLRSWELPSMPSAQADEWTSGWKIESADGAATHTFVAAAVEQRRWGELLRQQVGDDSDCQSPLSPSARGGTKLNGLRWEMPREAVDLEYVIGEGFFGKVHRGLLCKSTPVAVKIFTPGLISTEGLLKEMASLAGLTHPHMLQFYCMISDPETDSTWMVTELLAHGSLLDYLRQPDTATTLPLHRLSEIARQIADGMAYLEGMK